MIITREIAQELAHGGWREEPLGYYSSGQQLKPLNSMGIQIGDIPSRAHSVLPQSYVQDKLNELNAAC